MLRGTSLLVGVVVDEGGSDTPPHEGADTSDKSSGAVKTGMRRCLLSSFWAVPQ